MQKRWRNYPIWFLTWSISSSPPPILSLYPGTSSCCLANHTDWKTFKNWLWSTSSTGISTAPFDFGLSETMVKFCLLLSWEICFACSASKRNSRFQIWNEEAKRKEARRNEPRKAKQNSDETTFLNVALEMLWDFQRRSRRCCVAEPSGVSNTRTSPKTS